MTKEVSDIYHRYSPQAPPARNTQSTNRNQQPQSTVPKQTRPAPQQTTPNQQKPSQHHSNAPTKHPSYGQPQTKPTPQHPAPKPHPCGSAKQTPQPKNTVTSAKDSLSFLYNIIPRSLYNPESKKILGLLSAEDLLIIALIFLFLDNTEEDNLLIILALAYVLLSDHIDLSGFSF